MNAPTLTLNKNDAIAFRFAVAKLLRVMNDEMFECYEDEQFLRDFDGNAADVADKLHRAAELIADTCMTPELLRQLHHRAIDDVLTAESDLVADEVVSAIRQVLEKN